MYKRDSPGAHFHKLTVPDPIDDILNIIQERGKSVDNMSTNLLNFNNPYELSKQHMNYIYILERVLPKFRSKLTKNKGFIAYITHIIDKLKKRDSQEKLMLRNSQNKVNKFCSPTDREVRNKIKLNTVKINNVKNHQTYISQLLSNLPSNEIFKSYQSLNSDIINYFPFKTEVSTIPTETIETVENGEFTKREIKRRDPVFTKLVNKQKMGNLINADINVNSTLSKIQQISIPLEKNKPSADKVTAHSSLNSTKKILTKRNTKSKSEFFLKPNNELPLIDGNCKNIHKDFQRLKNNINSTSNNIGRVCSKVKNHEHKQLIQIYGELKKDNCFIYGNGEGKFINNIKLLYDGDAISKVSNHIVLRTKGNISNTVNMKEEKVKKVQENKYHNKVENILNSIGKIRQKFGI